MKKELRIEYAKATLAYNEAKEALETAVHGRCDQETQEAYTTLFICHYKLRKLDAIIEALFE